jgi:hypothetical protein
MKSTAAVEVEVLPKGGADTVVKNFKTQLKEAKNEAQLMVITFGEFSAEALAAQKKVAELSDKMDDFNDRVKALNPDKFAKVQTVVNGVASGFAAAQGAMALFGTESEDLQKQLVKVQGAMALAQGLEGLGKVQQQFTTLAKDSIQGVIKAFSTLRGAIIATGIGALAVALGLLVTYWDEIKEALTGVSKEQTKVNNAMRDSVATEQGNIQKLQSYQKLTEDTALTIGERKNALLELNKLGIETRDIDVTSAASLQILNTRIEDNIILIQQRAKATALEKIIAEESEKIFKEKNKTVDEQLSVIDELTASTLSLKNSIFGVDYITKETIKSNIAYDNTQKNVAKSQGVLDTATNEYNVLLKDLTKTNTKVEETTTEVNDAYEKQNAIIQNKLITQITALDKAKAKELANLNLTEKEKLEIENKYANLSIAAKQDAIKKEQKITGLITDPKQRLAQQTKLNQDLARLDVDVLNQKTTYFSGIKSLLDKEYELNLRNKQTYHNLQNETIDLTAQSQIDIIKLRGRYFEDRTKLELEIANVELKGLKDKLATYTVGSKEYITISQQISDKETEIHNKKISQADKEIAKAKEIRDAKMKAAADYLSAFSTFNDAESQQAQNAFDMRMEQLKQQGYSEEQITEMKDAELQKQDERLRQSFELNKVVQVASALMNTYEGVTAALAIKTELYPGQRFVEAGAALAIGLANVYKIQQMQYKSTMPTSGGSTSAGRQNGQGTMQSFAPRMSTLNTNDALTQNRKVFVTEGDITRTQRRVSNNKAISVVE